MALPSFMESKHITLCLYMLSHSVSVQLCDATDHSPPGSSSPMQEYWSHFTSRIFPILDRTRIFCISCFGEQILYHWTYLGSPYLGIVFYFCLYHLRDTIIQMSLTVMKNAHIYAEWYLIQHCVCVSPVGPIEKDKHMHFPLPSDLDFILTLLFPPMRALWLPTQIDEIIDQCCCLRIRCNNESF